MKKFLASMLLVVFSLFLMPAVNAEVQTFEGVGEYYMSETEGMVIARERAKQLTIRNAVEKAGVYLMTYSKSANAKLTDDEISAMVANIIKVTDVQYETNPLPDMYTILIRATVKVEIDMDSWKEWLEQEAKKYK